MPALRSFILAFCVCAAALPAAAQDRETKSDTLYYSGGVLSDSASVDPSKTYDLGEVVVGGAQNAPAARVTTVQAVPLAAIERTDAATVADIARLVPAASVQTNSRGETLVYLRNVGERQVAFFYDGALLNVPWDNRVDLSLVPASTVGRINIAKGAPSVLYGANVSGGVVNFVSRSLETEGQFTEAAMMAGTGSSRRGSVTHLRNSGDWRFLGSAGYVTREAIPIPNGSELPFGQIDDDRRTNTDLELFNVLLRGERAFGPNQRVAVSLLHFDGDKGIAPQSHIDPAQDRVRYWRYPTWRTSMLIGKGRTPAAGGILQGTIWASRFEQTIDQFESVAYASLGERQEDLDMTVGARLVFARPLGAGTVQLGLNALTSSHGQTDLDIAGGGTPFDQTYRQHVGSVGAEYEVPLAARTQLVAGLTFDALLTPETG
ncbi:MAG: TonB-dependent receptor plug domain-containing protein, partial [Bacteroidota bacterium]